jgi:hypothetical protein
MQTRLRWSLWWGLVEFAFGENLESGFRFCVHEFGKELDTVAVNMFSYLILFIKIFYKFYTFKIFAQIMLKNCILLNTKRFIPVI